MIRRIDYGQADQARNDGFGHVHPAEAGHDKVLNKLLYHMQKYGAEKAAMAVKLTVTLDRNSGLADGDVPRFEHKVTATVQRKDDVSGQLSGEYVLEEDGKGGYQLKTLIDQASMFESAE